jgi:hypothetical protein
MSYSEDASALARLEKLRLLALIIGFSCTLASIVLDLDWLQWPRAFAWTTAGVVSMFEARAEKRLGRDPDGSWLRAVLLLVVGATFFVLAARS